MVRFTLDHPTLRETLTAVPSTRIVWEESDRTDNGEMLLLLWVESEDFEAFEEATHADPTVTAPRCLTELGDRRLYQIEQTGEGRARRIHTELVAVGGIIHECVGTDGRWSLEVEFPDQDALKHFHSVCEEFDLDFRLVQKYEQSGGKGSSGDFGLTEKQRHALSLACEMGYFEVPRGSDLGTIAEELDISHQAASERVRRAVDVLVRHTIRVDDTPMREQEAD
ncbi:helix-turn-helix domain-containing protein [Halomarina litorea]|uniref:helix-turn-helix domain-containing protein n=1 Tax=Halomarina litorea TaxID=2961595 RepID=UPI0020C47B11|nr:helix-turn-helix domain-containing protein [Halomarina sp. BCD28]